MHRELRRLLALLIALVMVAAACGDDNDDEGGAGGDRSLEGETVEIVAKWTGGELEAAQAVMAAFTEETGIEVDLQGVGDDLPTILSTRVEGGNPPDLGQLPQPGLMADFAARNALQPIEDVVGDVVDERYAEAWRELGSHEGTLYGLWFKAANKSTVWYRVPAWEDAGVETPEDWDGWITSSQDLLDSGTTPLAVGGAPGWPLTDWFENVYLRTAGEDMYDQLVAHEIPWTDQSVKDALTTLGQLIGKPEFVAGGFQGALGMSFEDSVKAVFGADPSAATVYEGDFVAGVIATETEAEAGTDFDFFAFPSIEESPPAVVAGGDVVVMFNDTPAARRLLEYLATGEAGEIWAELGGFSSPNTDVALDAYPDDIARRAAEQLLEAESLRFDLSDLVPAAFGGTAGAGLWGRLQDWLANPSDIDGVTQRLEAEAQAAYG